MKNKSVFTVGAAKPVLKSAETAYNVLEGKTTFMEIVENAFKNTFYTLPGFLATVREPTVKQYLGQSMLGALASASAIQAGVLAYVRFNYNRIKKDITESDEEFTGALPSGREARRFIRNQKNYLGLVGTMAIRTAVLSLGSLAVGQSLGTALLSSAINATVIEAAVLNLTRKRLRGEVSGYIPELKI